MIPFKAIKGVSPRPRTCFQSKNVCQFLKVIFSLINGGSWSLSCTRGSRLDSVCVGGTTNAGGRGVAMVVKSDNGKRFVRELFKLHPRERGEWRGRI